MTLDNVLRHSAEFAEIVTGFAAIAASVKYVFNERHNSHMIQEHLRDQQNMDGGKRSMLHVMSHTGLTEAEVLKASFNKRHSQIDRAHDDDGVTDAIFLSYRK
jgi:hypothetical protein